MNKMLRLLALLTALLMLSTSALAELTAQGQDVCVTQDGLMRAIVYTSREGTLTPEDVSAQMDGTDVEVKAVTSYARSDLGTSWVFVVDLSRAHRAEDMKALLKGLISSMGEFDNAAIMTTGMPANALELSGNKNALEEKADAIARDSAANAINQATADALGFLAKDEAVKARTAIVVLSSGHNTDEKALTRAQLVAQLQGSSTAIYTIALQTSEPNKASVEGFGEIARSGRFGKEIRIPYNTRDMSGTISEINDNEALFRVVDVDPANAAAGTPEELDVTVKEGQAAMTVTFMLTDEQKTAIAERVIANLPTPQPTAAPTAVPTPVPTPEPTVMEKHGMKIGIAAGVVVLAVVVLVVLGKKKSGDDSEVMVVGSSEESGCCTNDAFGESYGPVSSSAKQDAAVTVVLDGVGTSLHYTVKMRESLVIGRKFDGATADVRLPDDRVSAEHLELIYRNGVMSCKDLGSRNGTMVNGTPIALGAEVVLHKQDVLNVGPVNLHINWME